VFAESRAVAKGFAFHRDAFEFHEEALAGGNWRQVQNQMVPAVFGALGVEAEFFKTLIFMPFEIFGIVEPPMNAIEELGNGDGNKTGVVVVELRFFVRGYRVAGFVKPFGWSQIKGADRFKLVRCECENAILDFGGTASERDK
jgi:hypothetical protein